MKKGVWVLLALFLAGCSSTFKLTPIAGQDDIIYEHGNSYAISKKTKSIIFAKMNSYSNKIAVTLAITNIDSVSRFDVDPLNANVKFIDENSNEILDAKIYPPEEWIKKIERDQMLTAFIAGLTQGIEAYNAGKTVTNTNITIHDKDGSYIQANAESETNDYGKNAELARQNAEQNRQMHSAFRNQIIREDNNLLWKTTLFPGQTVAGNIIIENYGQRNYQFKMKINDEEHVLEFGNSEFQNSSNNGILSVNTEPEGASVILGYQLLSYHAPFISRVNSGRYDINIRLKGFEEIKSKIEVHPYEMNTIEYEFKYPTQNYLNWRDQINKNKWQNLFLAGLGDIKMGYKKEGIFFNILDGCTDALIIYAAYLTLEHKSKIINAKSSQERDYFTSRRSEDFQTIEIAIPISLFFKGFSFYLTSTKKY